MVRKTIKKKSTKRNKNPKSHKPLPMLPIADSYKRRKPKLESDGTYILTVMDKSVLSKKFPDLYEDLKDYIEDNDITYGDGEYNLIPLYELTDNPKLRDVFVNIEA